MSVQSPWFGLPEPVTPDDPQVKCPEGAGHVPHAWAILRGVVLTPFRCPGSFPVEWPVLGWELERERITYMWQMANQSINHATRITVIT